MGKKDDSLHLCCDYCHLNSKTIADRYPLPKIQIILGNLERSQYFSIISQGKTYHQIHLIPESFHLTPFITLWDSYEWVRLPFDFMNAPAVFQRFMNHSFQDYRSHFVVLYLYDLLVFSSDFSSHLKHLQLTLQ